ncbi:PadR family transcriptional regulator [Alicyclobacillus sp. SO9]|uniref:PadR family transcriptional regulator n=1 Tax=Alicyclobacillus sp. SO9 TaxID=2665646 RepID=UPI0018E876E3|nr:PadR family transcriptional regulator [Alicyclobacillus sp. SO9]QQE79900.1 PadR family transcriptional regulator [Alicyclobacillus sp. SO9]
MDERSLLLLGMLRTQSQHGYQINEFIEQNLSRVIDIKRSTAYSILDRLSAAGYVDVTVEQEGNRPPRKVYAITPQGEAQFYELLRENLTEAEGLSSPYDIGLMFLDALSQEEALAAVKTRIEKLQYWTEMYENAPRHGFGVGVDLAVEHRLMLVKAELDWLKSVRNRIGSAQR